MSRSSVVLSPPATQDERSLAALVRAAIAIGRLPGEPATVLHPGKRRFLLALLLGRKSHGPLADPRLEVIRAISASLSRGVGTIRRDLIAAAAKAGWSRDDLSLMFPAELPRAMS